jgi:hypothetical protein
MNQISISPSKDHLDREAEFRDCGNEQETCAHPQKAILTGCIGRLGKMQ